MEPKTSQKRKLRSSDTVKVSPTSVVEIVDDLENIAVHEFVASYKNKKDPPVDIYFHADTTEAQRDFIYRVLHYFFNATKKDQFKQSIVNVMIGLDEEIRAPCTNNRSMQKPIHCSFQRADAISSAVRVIQNQRNIQWPLAQRHLPKFYMRIGDGEYMEVI